MRDKTIRVIELEAIIRRLEQENEMIERRLDQSLNMSLPAAASNRRPFSSLVGWDNMHGTCYCYLGSVPHQNLIINFIVF